MLAGDRRRHRAGTVTAINLARSIVAITAEGNGFTIIELLDGWSLWPAMC
ncbi:hypothetical protein [uncultured Paracoccus sp.]|nr:hypothetical protein [uncultured Paracoccus sp.]